MSKKKGMIVSGYFNPLHKGHIEYFQNAKNKAVRNFFNGQTYNAASSGKSLKDYIAYMTEDTILNDAILTKFEEANQLINGLNDNFVNQINADNDLMIAVFNKLQEGVILLKTDMLSVLSISVDYIDADGD